MVLRGTAEREGALAYIAGGLVGVPIGLGLLQALPTRTFPGGLGLFLVVYGVLVLLKPDSLRIKLSGWKPAVAVGAAGGIIGGFSAFPGSMPVVYLGLRGLSKTETRGITQPYILAFQLISLSILALTHSAIFNVQFWLLSHLHRYARIGLHLAKCGSCDREPNSNRMREYPSDSIT